jgi:hypothetical protein
MPQSKDRRPSPEEQIMEPGNEKAESKKLVTAKTQHQGNQQKPGVGLIPGYREQENGQQNKAQCGCALQPESAGVIFLLIRLHKPTGTEGTSDRSGCGCDEYNR